MNQKFRIITRVQHKDELQMFLADEIFSRLIAIHEEMAENPDRLPKSYKDADDGEVFLQNIQTLSDGERKCVHLYLSYTLDRIQNDFFRNQKGAKQKKGKLKGGLCDATEAAACGLDIMRWVQAKRAYQTALIVWYGRGRTILGRNPSLPKEVQDRAITQPLGNAICQKMTAWEKDWRERQFTAFDVPSLIEKAIQMAKEQEEETILKKASALLPIVNQAISDYEAAQKNMPLMTKVLEEVEKLLYKDLFGKVSIKDGYIEIDPNDPGFHFHPDVLEQHSDGHCSLLDAYIAQVGKKLGLREYGVFLKSKITSLPNGCIKVEIDS